MSHRWLFALAFVLTAAGAARDGFESWVSSTRVPPVVHAVSTEVLDRKGALLRAYPVENGIWRLATTPDQVDPTFLDLLIATEDKRFAEHAGVDLRALIRAAGTGLWHGRIVSGGSTLTMQTARLIENSGTGTWKGKLRQIRLALALERRMSKSDILALYLTHAPYGANLEGVRAASYAWFAKPPRRLSPAEAALLVALPQAPTARRPDRHPDRAQTARDRILRAAGLQTPRTPVPDRLHAFPSVAPHLSDLARATFPDARIVPTTLEAGLQSRLERLTLRAGASLPRGGTAAILVADHQSGDILGYVGSSRFGSSAQDGFVDMVRAVRSPGSTLKPLIYALAMDQGLVQPETIISDTPISLRGYAPQNFDGVFRGDVTVRRALELSLNIPPVRLTEAMGPARLMAGLRNSGGTPRLPGGEAGLAIALGGIGLTLADLVQLYAGLANGGQARPLSWQVAPETIGNRIVSASAAWHVGHILAGNLPPHGGARGQIAYKTGTSYGHRDAWAIGWDGRHVIGVWLGRPDGTPVPGIFGGDVAAPILFEAFGRLKPALDPLPPPPPETLLLSTAALPLPLQRFAARDAVQAGNAGVEFAFPPDGAKLRASQDRALLVKVRGGTPPFAVLANGRPVRTGLRARDLLIEDMPKGASQLRVLDSVGGSSVVDIRVD